jgi:hypothetical protein
LGDVHADKKPFLFASSHQNREIGLSRNIRTPPTKEIFAAQRGREETFVSDNSKGVSYSKGAGGGLTSDFLHGDGMGVPKVPTLLI